MSYITEVKIKVNLRIDTPLNLIEWLTKEINDRLEIPFDNHPFFNCDKWADLFSTMGYESYEQPYLNKVNNHYELLLHADINYIDETLISDFLDWIKPFVKGRKKKVYCGWYLGMRDEYNKPNNIYIYR